MPKNCSLLTFSFLLVSCLLVSCCSAPAEVCSVAAEHSVTAADRAMLDGQYAKAESLYREGLAQVPLNAPAGSSNAADLTAALIHALLAEQKVDAAAALVQQALTANPNSPALLTALADVQFRQGTPWLSADTLQRVEKITLCYPLAHLSLSHLMQVNSNYASAFRELSLAHQLDPYDEQIRREWTDTLPVADRIVALKQFLASGDPLDPTLKLQAQMELALLQDRVDHPGHACHLANTFAQTEIPFQPIVADANHISGWGLDVAFNGKKSRLILDTGAGGLYVSRSVAQHAGLKPVAQDQVGGIGDRGPQNGYLAYADSIKIGNLEFKDCLVSVSDSRNVVDQDGLIGADVFSNFLVTLDFPFRKLRLDPLPPYPGTSAGSAPVQLDTRQDSSSQVHNGAPAKNTTTGNQLHDSYQAPEMKDYTRVYRVGHDLIVPAGLNGKAVHLFLIDTGSFSTTVSPEVGREVTKLQSDDDLQVKGVSGYVKRVYSADKIVLRFGHLRQELDGVASFDNSTLSRDIGMNIGGFIGFNTLDVLVIRIDYRDGLVDFDYEKNRGYNHFY